MNEVSKRPSHADRLLLAFFLAFSFHSLLQAAFKDPGYGVRPAGMGGAFVAVADDSNAVLYNPAGAIQSLRPQASFMHAKLFTGLDDSINLSLNSFFALYAVSARRVVSGPLSDEDSQLRLGGFDRRVRREVGGVGASGVNSTYHVSSKVRAFGVGWTNFRAPVYREDTVFLLGAMSLNQVFPDIRPQLSIGSNVKFLKTKFDLDARAAADPVFDRGRGRNAVAVDLGFWSQPDPERLPDLRLGLAARNVNKPDIGLDTVDEVRREFAGGMAYDWSHLTFALDVVKRDGETAAPRAGLELRLWDDRFALRGGGNPDAAAAGMSYNLNVGERLSVGLDYALSVPLSVDGSGGSHRISTSMRF